MDFGNILGKAKDLVGNTAEIGKLVDQLPDNIKSKVKPLVDQFIGGDTAAASKAVDVLKTVKNNDAAKQLLEKLPK